MKFCQDHWDRLRALIADRGLDGLVARGGVEAARRTMDELQAGRSLDNFDPLMSAHWAIVNNSMEAIKGAGGSPLYLIAGGPEDPVVGYGPEHEGRTWPRCPLCYVNQIHELTCHGGSCTLPKLGGFDWMLERAADDARDQWRKLGAPTEPTGG